MGQFSVVVRSATQTEALGAALSAALESCLAPQSAVPDSGRAADLVRAAKVARAGGAWTLHLSGDLGAGKTTLVRGALRHLGIAGAVRSPTFSIMESYAARGWHVLHLDLYRLRTADELLGLGLADYDQSDAFWMIEWPERGGSRLPTPDLSLQLSALAEPAHDYIEWRQVSLQSHSPRGQLWFDNLEISHLS